MKPLRIGIWLELGVGAPFAHEGLARLLYFIASGVEQQHVRFVMVCPKWLEPEVRRGIEGLHEAERNKFEIHSPFAKPNLGLRFASWFLSRPQSLRRAKRQRLRVRVLARRALTSLLSTVFNLRSGVTFVLVAAVLLPLTAAVSLLVAVGAGLSIAVDRVGTLFKRHAVEAIRKISLWGQGLGQRVARDIYERALHAEFSALAKKANHSARLDLWFLLNPFAVKYAHYLQGPVISLMADFVFASCPSGFTAEVVGNARNNLQRIDNKIVRYITLSEHVMRDHAIGYFNIPSERVTCIKHGVIDISHFLPQRIHQCKTAASRAAAAECIREYLAQQSHENGWLRDYLLKFAFEDCSYVLISTQNRPYKNVFRCVQAVRDLIKLRGRCIKLILTGALPPHIEQYVMSESLIYEVLPIPRVPNKIHAALYHCAQVAAHVSFFEGGVGAFAFDEAISVGTPIVLARNNATLELSSDAGYRSLLADPYSLDDIRDKLDAALSSPEQWYAVQANVYNQMKRRTWQVAGQEYYRVFKEVAKVG